MDRHTDTEREGQLSTDRDTIRGWAGEHDAVPVRYSGTEGESGRLHIVPEHRRTDEHEEVTWDEFHEELDREDRAVVYYGAEADEPFEVLGTQTALQRTTLEDEAVEDALLEGEVVTTEITETTVVEREIVEEATIESQVIDREVTEEEIVDAELLTREVADCEVTDLGSPRTDGTFEPAQFEAGYRSDDVVEVAVDVDEGWTVTREVLERLTVESRVADMDVTETDTVEDASVETAVDVEGVQQTILESDLIDTDAATTEVIDSGSIQSESGTGDVVHTQLWERKTVQEDVSLEKRYTGEIAGGETTAATTIDRDVVESEIAGGEEIEFDIETVVDTETAVETELEGRGGTDAEAETATGAAAPDEESATAGGGATEASVTPSEDDVGKTVVDSAGEEIGMVAEVEGGTIYVDPHPSLTDRIRAALDWGEMDEDAYPLKADRVARITDDRVELTVDAEEDTGA